MKSRRSYFTLHNIPRLLLQRWVGLLLLFLLPLMASAQVNFEAPNTTVEQALAKAKAENKLIFIWQSTGEPDLTSIFKTPEVNELMNSRFVNFKVDATDKRYPHDYFSNQSW